MSFATISSSRGFPARPDQSSNSSSSSSSSHTASAYEKTLWQWAQQAQQEEVYTSIMAWVKKGNPEDELVLSRLNLDALPPLPEGVKRLDASYNRISEITEDLPPTLVDVKLNDNDFLQVPRSLPWENLNSLNLANNRITHLPFEISTVSAVCDLWLGNNPLDTEQTGKWLESYRPGLSRLKTGFAITHRRQTATLGAPFAPRFRNRKGEEMLFIAIDCNRADKVEQLLGHGEIDLNYRLPHDSSTALLRATIFGYKKIVRLLSLDPRTNPNLPLPDGTPPLGVALIIEPFEMACVDALLNHPATDPNLPNANGNPPLHAAVISQNLELLLRLLDHPRINPNTLLRQPNSFPVSALTVSLMHNPKMATLILAHPAIDVNADNGVIPGTGHRNSVLRTAVKHGRGELIVALLEKGARVDHDLERSVQRTLALAVGKACLETLSMPDQFLISAAGASSHAQGEQALSQADLAVHQGLKREANALLKRLYELTSGPGWRSGTDLAFRLAAMAWYSRQAPDSTGLYSDSPSAVRLKALRNLDNVITMRALPREKWAALAVEVARWLRILSSAETRTSEPEERLLDLPRRDLPVLTRDILEAWQL